MGQPYPGPWPSNVNKDAKYSVRSGSDGMEVTLVFRLGPRERTLLATSEHQRLVDMVNEVKVTHNGAPGGPFYINEYMHVVVPTQSDGCIYAGHYDDALLEFEFEGETLGPRAPDGLRPGDPWLGPHVGISYVLVASGDDIRYSVDLPNRTVDVHLSDEVGRDAARQLARRLGEHKGQGGGRIYINEASDFFAPINGTDGVSYRYLGHLDDDAWFPTPDVSGS